MLTNNKKEKVFATMVCFMTIVVLFILVFIIVFILKESLIIFQEVSIKDFIFGREWRPTSVNPRFGLFPIIMGTLSLTLGALLWALPFSIGTALFISQVCPQKWRRGLRAMVDLMAGIPSVIYGFLGVVIILPAIETFFDQSSGDSVLAGIVVLGIMIMPFMVSIIAESMETVVSPYISVSKSLGISKWYMIRRLVLPGAWQGILAGVVLGTSRAMGETMAVMMVVGNSALIPETLLDRIKPITSLIALEIGSAPVNSLHYHGIFGAGFVLLMVLLVINIGFYKIRKKISGED